MLLAGTAGVGVFESTDGGRTWQALNEGLGNLTVLSLLITSAGERFAGTVGGVYRRAGGDAVWELTGADVLTLTVTFVAANPHRPATLYAGTGGLVFVSDDRGRHWRELAETVAGAAGPAPAPAPAAVHTHGKGGDGR